MAQVDVNIRNWVIVGLLALTFAIVFKMVLLNPAIPTPAFVRQAARAA